VKILQKCQTFYLNVTKYCHDDDTRGVPQIITAGVTGVAEAVVITV